MNVKTTTYREVNYWDIDKLISEEFGIEYECVR